MTSGRAVDSVLGELRFGAAAEAEAGHGVAVDGGPFRFAADFDAPERWPDVPYDTAAPSARHGAAARAHVCSVLDEAASTMARRAPAARRLVDAQLQRVLLRCDAGTPGGSASHRHHVGSCLLTNLHGTAQAVSVAIEAVTHEAIHQLLYRTEQADGDFCDLSELATFRSPWSGARLPLHSLVHASFVWWGLLALWSELARRQPASAAESLHARGRISVCLFGFAFLDDLLDGPGFPADDVRPDVLEALRRLSIAARRASHAAEPGATLRRIAASRDDPHWPAAVAARLARDPH